MKKQYYLLAVLFLFSAIVVAGVQNLKFDVEESTESGVLSNFVFYNMIENGDLEGQQNEDWSYFMCHEWREDGSESYRGPATIVADPTDNNNHCIKVTSRNSPTENNWDSQFFIYLKDGISSGNRMRVSMRVRADKAATVSTQVHAEPGDYIHNEICGNLDFTEQWQTFTWEGTITEEQSREDKLFQTIAFNLSEMQESNTYYFDDIVIEVLNMQTADVSDGVYYLYNVATKKYLAAGSTWGTHAIVNDVGLDLIFTKTDEKYTIDTQILNEDDSHYLNNEWLDSEIADWTINDIGDGMVLLGMGQKFLTAAEDNIVNMTEDFSDASVWKLVTLEERVAELKTATLSHGINATFLIQGSSFGRNDLRNDYWSISEDCSNSTISGGNNMNNVAEFYHTTATISQVLTNAPAGNYQMVAQGFYRQDGNDNRLPYFFANSETQEFLIKAGDENSMSDASESFSNGLYAIDPIFVTVATDGDLTIGVKNEYNTRVWGIFDNFQLIYYGSEGDVSELKPVNVDMTDKLVNPDFELGVQGWSKIAVEGGNVDIGGTSDNQCYEGFNNEDFDIYQTIDNMPKGIYELSVQGFFRYLTTEDAYRAYYDGNVNNSAYFYMNDNIAPFTNMFDEPVYDSYFYQSVDGGSYYYESNYTGAYFPNNMQAAAKAFSSGMYQNTAYGAVFNEGEAMRIGVKGNTSAGNKSWAIWDNFKLTYWGKAPVMVSKALTKAIDEANKVLNTQMLTSKGTNQLQQAISTAATALNENNGDTMFAALENLYKTTSNTLNREVLEQEVITFNSSDNGVQVSTIQGNYATLTFSQANGSNVPKNYSGYIRMYANNTLNIASEKDILDISFNPYSSSYDVYGTADNGTLENNHWYGNGNNITLSNNSGSQWRFNKVIITYDNPSDSEIFERLQNQLEESEAVLANLSYANVPGNEYVSHLVSLGRDIELNEGFDGAYVKRLIKELQQQTEWLTMVDNHYKLITSRIAAQSELAANNKFVDPEILAEATAYGEDLTAGLVEGKYSWDDFEEIYNRLNEYANIFQQIYLVLHIEEPGSLGDSILAYVENFSDVIGLRVSGNLNSDDMYNLKNRITNLKYLNLAETSLYYIADEQFRNHTALRNIVLPKNLNYIYDYAFYGCTNLEDITFPVSLKTIGDYAFYNCSLQNVVIPEGVTEIGYYAFSSNSGYDYIYDENGYHMYDENGNYLIKYYCKLNSVSLPSTLRSIGTYAFSYQRYLNTVTIADGLTNIPDYAFYYCTGLTNLRLPSTLQSIGSNAFYSCSSLKKVELPDAVTTINSYAFNYCSNLEEVVLPSMLKAINYPFQSCNKLTRMTCKSIVPPYANSNIMGGNERQCTLTVPNLSVNVYKQTSYWDQFNIVGVDILPETIIISDTYKMNWPELISASYKPNIIINDWNLQRFGSLIVNGNSTLSVGQLTIKYDPNTARNNSYYENGNYTHNRFAYASLINNANMRADNITTEFWMKANTWEFLTIPYDVKVSDIRENFAGTPLVIRKYDGEKRAAGLTNETWVDMTADSILQAGQGYIWRSASTDANRNYTGFYLDALQTVNKNNIFINGNVEVPLNYYESEFVHNRSWNLIGNPYPCYYDIRAMQTSAPITIWDTYQNNYRAFSPQDDAYILNPGQAFFVQRPVDEESITFLKEGRQSNLTVRDIEYNNGAREIAPRAPRSVFNVILSNGEQSDRTRFVINANAMTTYEQGRDASKFASLEHVSQLYTIEDGVRFAINERPYTNGIVILGMQIVEEGTYTLKLDTKVDNEVWLIDGLTGKEVLLSGNEDGYTFSSKAGTFDNRFVVRLGNGDVTGIKTKGISEGTSKIYNLNGIRVEQPTKGLYINNGKKVVVK